MGFTAILFHLIASCNILKFPQTYAQFLFIYPQSIVANKKRVGKARFPFSTRCELIIPQQFKLSTKLTCAFFQN